MKSGIMKLLVVFAGLLWMSLPTEGIPIDVARKNQPKTPGLSDIINISQGQVAPPPSDPIIDENKIHETADAPKSDVVPEPKSEPKNDGTLDLNNVPKKIKTGSKNKLDKTLSNTSNGLRNKVKTSTRKIKAKVSYFESDDALPKRNKTAPRRLQNRTIDLSDIDDVLSDKLKKKFGQYVQNGFGKNVEELSNIRKKMRILRKITGSEKAISTTNKAAPPAASDSDDILFEGDEELDEAQLNSIIESTARHYGVDMEPLKKYGIKNNRPKRQSWVAPDDVPVDRLWPTTTSIKYYYDANVTTQTRNIIQKALQNIENQTCLWFTSSSTATPRIQFVNWGDACASPVGLNPTTGGNGIHKIKIGPCTTNYGSIAHEILHVLGIKHQQIRSDRDDYLVDAGGSETILDEFNSDNFGSPYDYGSVMHYSAFEANQPLYQQTLGHRVGPSFADIAVLNQRYSCFCEDPTVTCLNGGYPDPNNCGSCICPHGYGGTTCTGIDPGTEGKSEIITDLDSECQTLEKSLGTQNNIQYDFYSKAWVQFKAPAGKKVQLIFVNAADGGQTYSKGCDNNGIELKNVKSKFNRTGYVFCGNNEMLISESNDDIKTFTSTTNMAMLQLYTKKNKINVTVRYRYVDSADDEVPSSCFPVLDEDPNCQNIEPDSSCEGWNNNPAENCEADEEWMDENCAKTCGAC